MVYVNLLNFGFITPANEKTRSLHGVRGSLECWTPLDINDMDMGNLVVSR